MNQSKNPDHTPLLQQTSSIISGIQKKRLVINKRELKSQQAEKCGRIRLVVLTMFVFMFIYILNITWKDSNFLVTIPEDDKDWPGPKDKFKNLITKTPSINISLTKLQNLSTTTTTTTTTNSTTTTTTPNYTTLIGNSTIKYNETTITDTNNNQNVTSTTYFNMTTPKTTTSANYDHTYANEINYYKFNLTTNEQIVPKGYIVYGPGCKMPDYDPLAPNVMKLFHKEKYEECSTKKPLTKIVKNYTTGDVLLFMDEKNHKHNYSKIHYCCYQEIHRSGSGNKADKSFNLSSCTPFKKTVLLPPTTEFVLVKCKENDNKKDKNIYKSAHTAIRRKKEIDERLEKFRQKDTKRPLSVLMIGIDSISRLNLIRAMPYTAQYLYNNGWFELKGYNKIDDNTFPNLMGVLVGYNNKLAYTDCNPKKLGKLESCKFMWNHFEESGYVTAYGEDEASINTFNYNKLGFVKPPTDYYIRPFLLAAEKNLSVKRKSSLTFCLGFKHSADYIYDYAIDFVKTYKNESFFGLFWTNTFSHNAISDPSSMDKKMTTYLEELENNDILNTSMVVFFSDHGIRFGPVRQLETGWLEERLPFIFISLPKWFQDENPEIVKNLKVNRNRLTNPYDLHLTLKHVLEVSGRANNLPPAKSCPLCQSLFDEISFNRSCDDVEIVSHWCTCTEFAEISEKSSIIKLAVFFVIDILNEDLQSINNSSSSVNLCAELKMKKIHKARKGTLPNKNLEFEDYVVVFETVPGDGIFEATVRFFIKPKKFTLAGSVSRLNSYDSQSKCIHIDRLKKYCYCITNSK